MSKSIKLYLVNDVTESLIIGEILNWNGKAIKIPRIEVSTCNREELTKTGVYFLFGKTDNEEDAVYIGESDNVKRRLLEHINNYASGRKNFYWNNAVAFIGNDLNATLIQYLEHKFVKIARKCKRFKVITMKTHNAHPNEAEKDAMDQFAENVRLLINALGYKVLEPLVPQSGSSDNKLYLKTREASAVCLETAEGFVVYKGSKLVEENYESCTMKSILNRRDQYKAEGKIENNILQEDTIFSSSSAAATFVLGRNASGPNSWKNRNGITLKELEANQQASFQAQ